MASIQINRHGYIQIRFRLDGEQFSEKTRIKAERKSDGVIYPENTEAYKGLKRWVKVITQEIKAGTFDYLVHFPTGNKAHLFQSGSGRVFRHHAAHWLKEKSPPEVREKTARGYEGIANTYLIPLFADKTLNYFSSKSKTVTNDLKALLKQRNASARTMHAVFAQLRRMLNDENIDFKIPKFSGARRRRKLDYYSDYEEVNTLIKAFDPFWQPWFIAAFYTGMRPSEQVALRLNEIDFKVKKIPIYWAIVEGVEGPPKTEESQRTIDMLPEVESAIQSWLKIRPTPKNKTTEKYLFLNKEGAYVDHNSLYKYVWKPTLKRLGLQPKVMYATRHTFATINSHMGKSLPWVAHMMGDNLTTVVKNYFHPKQ